MKAIEEIKDNGKLLAFIIRSEHEVNGVEFYTPNEYPQQLAAMGHPKGKKIVPHMHNTVERTVNQTQEVLFIKKGKLKVDFYREDKSHISSSVLNANDTIFLVGGGHGFEVLEDLQMIEVKQGPFVGEADKVRFEGSAQ